MSFSERKTSSYWLKLRDYRFILKKKANLLNEKSNPYNDKYLMVKS
jgi:hypothetical protein